MITSREGTWFLKSAFCGYLNTEYLSESIQPFSKSNQAKFRDIGPQIAVKKEFKSGLQFRRWVSKNAR